MCMIEAFVLLADANSRDGLVGQDRRKMADTGRDDYLGYSNVYDGPCQWARTGHSLAYSPRHCGISGFSRFLQSDGLLVPTARARPGDFGL